MNQQTVEAGMDATISVLAVFWAKREKQIKNFPEQKLGFFCETFMIKKKMALDSSVSVQ